MSIFPADEFGNLLTSKSKSPALKGSSERWFPLCLAVPSVYLLNSFIFSFNSFISLDVRGLALVVLGVSVVLGISVYYSVGFTKSFPKYLSYLLISRLLPLKNFFNHVLLCSDKYCSNSSSDFNAEEFLVVVIGVPNISGFPFPNQDLAVFILLLQLELIVGSTIL